MKEKINSNDYFLVVNNSGEFYYISEDGYYDGFNSGLEYATIFNDYLFKISLEVGKFKESDVKKIYFILKEGMECDSNTNN